jgi:hypothetical protein
LISFPRGTEMCHFPRLPSCAYVFSAGRRRITGAGFSHSEIRGSKAVQRLTAAYRSRPRPSSAPGAKASTMCPSYLDGDRCSFIGQLCSFQGPARGIRRPTAAAGLSKLNSMLASPARPLGNARPLRPLPGSVDISGQLPELALGEPDPRQTRPLIDRVLRLSKTRLLTEFRG